MGCLQSKEKEEKVGDYPDEKPQQEEGAPHAERGRMDYPVTPEPEEEHEEKKSEGGFFSGFQSSFNARLSSIRQSIREVEASIRNTVNPKKNEEPGVENEEDSLDAEAARVDEEDAAAAKKAEQEAAAAQKAEEEAAAAAKQAEGRAAAAKKAREEAKKEVAAKKAAKKAEKEAAAAKKAEEEAVAAQKAEEEAIAAHKAEEEAAAAAQRAAKKAKEDAAAANIARQRAKEEAAAKRAEEEAAKKKKQDTKHTDPAADLTTEDSRFMDQYVPAAGEGGGNKKSKYNYKGGGPKDSKGNFIADNDAEFHPVFGEEGLLFRVVKGKQWFYYNDTDDYEMHATWKFGPSSTMKPLFDKNSPKSGGTWDRNEEDWMVATLVIYPGETKGFVEGTPNGYSSSHNAKGLSAEYIEEQKKIYTKKIKAEVSAVKAMKQKDDAARLERCVADNTMYIDLDFQPGDSSLSRPGVDRRQLASQAWKRPTDYLRPDDHDKIRAIKKPEPGDIDQGQLGDCWFLCSVASLAEFPAKIMDVFKHPKDNADHRKKEEKLGAYHVTLNKNGWWHVYIVDSYLPCVGDRPCYAKCMEDPAELWVSLLEKAYAKAHGSYASIAGGDALQALQDLTGYPINRFDSEWEDAMKSQEKSDELFNDLVVYDQEDYLINLNTPGKDDSAYNGAAGQGNGKAFVERYKKAGLGMGHAYSVLTVKDFPNFSGGHLRLLQIRNPWGNATEWTGAWSDDDKLWEQHPDIAKECNFVQAADGAFWMRWEDAKEYFDGGGVCVMKTNWHDFRVQGCFQQGIPNCVLEIRVTTKPVNVYLIISQKDKRGLAEDDPDAKYAAMILSVAKGFKQGGKARQEVDCYSSTDVDKPTTKLCFNYSRELALKYTFEPSDEPYVVVPRMYGSGKDASHKTKDYVLGVISDQTVGDALGFEVDFKTLDKGCKVFSNYPKFDYDASPFETQFQYNPEIGCPVTSKGTSLKTQ